MDRNVLADVHRFWFGELKSPDDTPSDKAQIWFKQSDETDRTIRERFAASLDDAAVTDWNLADLTRVEQVGLVVLLDQFPRNIFRTSGQAFAYDAKARAIAGALLKEGAARFYPPERGFLFLPLMHSEDIADQEYCLWLYVSETLSAPPERKDGLRMGIDFSTRHRDIIRKFGRFPHRNVVLGRESTPEEVAFLKSGRGF